MKSTGILVNDLIVWKQQDKIERVLWIDPGGIICYTIDIFASTGVPEVKRVSEIIEAFEDGLAGKMINDPLVCLVPEKEIGKADREIRDKAWNIVEPLISMGPDIFVPDIRGKLVRKAAEEHKVQTKTVYKYLRRFWQRGMIKNSLLGNYSNSGGRGKSKACGSKKRGRPTKYGKPDGVNIDKNVQRMFRVAIERYYNTKNKNPLNVAYNYMLRDFFTEDYYWENGVLKPILIPSEERPTKDQFRYWFNKEKKDDEVLKSRIGRRKYNLEARPIIGNIDKEGTGPGSRYQIDATVVDVYLISRFNRNWIVGRPVLYVVVDVFSRMVVGMSVMLEGPSWIGAAQALNVAFSPKAEFCAEYGIEIGEADWPSYGIPRKILGDRGEMISKTAQQLVERLGITVENTPPYRPDWKPCVERYFRTVQAMVKPWMPGYVDPDYMERGGPDYRLDAKLNIWEFTKIMIRCMLYHNHRYLDKYNLSKDMISENVKPVPIELWNWGLQHYTGELRAVDEDVVRLNLMPSDTARVTPKGIIFKRIPYSCDLAVKENWFGKARIKKSWPVNISYDPRNMNYIYIRDTDNRSFIKCQQVPNSKYNNVTLEEINYLHQYLDTEAQEAKHSKNPEEWLSFAADIENEVKIATDKTDRQLDRTASKRSRTKAIRKHRSFEKEELQKEQSFELEKEDHKMGDIRVFPAREPETDLDAPDYSDLIARTWSEEKNDE